MSSSIKIDRTEDLNVKSPVQETVETIEAVSQPVQSEYVDCYGRTWSGESARAAQKIAEWNPNLLLLTGEDYLRAQYAGSYVEIRRGEPEGPKKTDKGPIGRVTYTTVSVNSTSRDSSEVFSFRQGFAQWLRYVKKYYEYLYPFGDIQHIVLTKSYLERLCSIIDAAVHAVGGTSSTTIDRKPRTFDRWGTPFHTTLTLRISGFDLMLFPIQGRATIVDDTKVVDCRSWWILDSNGKQVGEVGNSIEVLAHAFASIAARVRVDELLKGETDESE